MTKPPTADLTAWLAAELAAAAGIPAHMLDPRERFSRYGLDSKRATALLARASEHLGRPLQPTLVWEYPTLEALARHLAGERAPASAETVATRPRADRIAVIGIACRFPGASDPETYWRLLEGGVDAVTEIPAGRWDVSAYYDPNPAAPGKMSTRWGGFLHAVDRFDATFFGISPREAVQIDPQQRLALELAWEALEDAGLPADSLRGSRTGVFLGAMWSDYARIAPDPESVTSHTATGLDLSIVPARISYSLGLEGPSIAVDTACSSSLVAVHLACRSLAEGESDVALAGGVNLILSPHSTVMMSKFGAMAPDGRSKAFDARANGYVRGEGGAIVVLKPLPAAIAAGDPIHAVIRGSAVNNDGFSNGLTAPNPKAQEAVLREACARAGVDPLEVGYVETHGTGTLLGDPIEAGALGAVFGKGRPADRPLLIGSVKTNIGHLEAAAGIAGLVKVALSLSLGTIPPSLHCQEPSPHIPFAELSLEVARRPRPWPEPRIAGVSSFGFGGTNAHVILESSRPSPTPSFRGGSPVHAVFVFPGQGSQWPGMGRSLLAAQPVFRAELERCDEAIARESGSSVLEAIAGGASLEGIGRIQPALFAIEVALAALWRSWGVEPAAVVGHSMGEVAAACVAGALSLEDAARVICRRSALLSGAEGEGAMAVVELALPEARALLAGFEDRLSIAAANGPSETVLSGDGAALDEVLGPLARRGVFARRIEVDVASHSPRMDPLGRPLELALEGIRPRRADVPLLSTVRGEYLDGREMGPRYWVENLRGTVLFAPAVERLAREGNGAFLEASPHPILLKAIQAAASGLAALPSMRRDEDELAVLLESARALGAPGPPGERAVLFPLSARDPRALGELARATSRRLEKGDLALADLAETAGRRRAHHDHRLAVVARSSAELARKLPAAPVRSWHGRPPRVVFVFPGQGSQWPGMGRRLLEDEPVFKKALEDSDEAARPYLGRSLVEAVARPEAAALEGIEVVQPALFAVELALAALWRSWGVEPVAVAGHSMGEVAAAAVAGALSLEDAALVICRRSRLLGRIAGKGGMALVELPLEEAAAEIAGVSDRLSVAASNGPRATLLSGDVAALDETIARLEERGVFARRVKVDVASHSPQVDALEADLLAALAGIAPRAGSIPIVSTVTGQPLGGGELGPEYWAKNLRQPVLFHPVVARLLAEGANAFVEASPHPLLLPSIEDAAAHAGAAALVVGSLLRDEGDRARMLESLGALYAAGAPVDWRRVQGPGRIVRLPGYPWQRERYWLEPSRGPRRGRQASNPLLGRRVPSPLEDVQFEAELSANAPLLGDHRIHGPAVLAGAAYVSMLLSAAGTGQAADLAFEEALVVADGEPRTVQLVLSGPSFRVASLTGDAWTVHATGAIPTGDPGPIEPVDLAAATSRSGEEVPAGAFYEELRRAGYQLGPSFRWLESIRRGAGEAVARMRAPGPGEAFDPASIHPGLLDSVFQLLLASFPGGGIFRRLSGSDVFVPVGIASLSFRPGARGPLRAWARTSADSGDLVRGEVALLEEDGTVRFRAEGLAFRRVDRAALLPRVSRKSDILYETAWRRSELPRVQSAPGRWCVLGSPGLEAALAARGAELAPLDSATGVAFVARGADSGEELLALVQSLASREDRVPPRLVVAASGLETSSARGLARVVAHEIPQLRCRHIDFDGASAGELAAEVLAEGAEDEVALREGDRLVPRLVRSGRPAAPPPVLRADSSYLVTGGLGALGLEVARWMVRRGARRLALLGRKAPSEEAREMVRAMASAGAQVVVLAADVARRDELESALERAGDLAGVVHAAGVLDDSTVLALDRERWRTVLAPKVDGAWNLHELTLDRSLDFFVLFGSVASLLGTPGQANYAAANAYLDALAHHRRDLGLPALAIDWGPWSEVGLATGAGRAERLADRGIGSLRPSEALAALEALLAGEAVQVGVMPFDPVRWRPRSPWLSELESAPAEATPPRPVRRGALRDRLREEIAAVLHQSPDRIESGKTFGSLGFDSLLAMELRNRLEASLGISLPATLVWRYPTFEKLAAHLEERLAPEVAAARPDPGRLESILADLERLTDEEAEAALERALLEEGMPAR